MLNDAKLQIPHYQDLWTQSCYSTHWIAGSWKIGYTDTIPKIFNDYLAAVIIIIRAGISHCYSEIYQ